MSPSSAKTIGILFLLLFHIPLSLSGQDLKILVSDSASKSPLPFANIYCQKSGIGASTDLQGLAYFKLSEFVENDSMIISYIGYHTQRLPVAKIDLQKPLTVLLVPASEFLAEVLVSYVVPPPPITVLKKAIKNTSENYANQDVILSALYRETLNENGTYIQLNEAFTKTFFTAYPKKKLDKKIWKDWTYDESYAFEFTGTPYFRPLLNDFNTAEDHQTIVASRHSENLSKYGIESTLTGGPLLLLAFDKIKYQYDFLNPSLLKKYQFKQEESEIINGVPCYVISFFPKPTNRRFRIDMAKKNKRAIYIGRMYITKSSFALVKFQYKLAVKRDYGFFAKRMPLDYQVEMNYKKHNGFYAIDNIKFSETKKVGKKDNGEAILHTATKELLVEEIQTKNVKPFPDSIHFKSNRFSSIRHYKRNYQPSYWNNIPLENRLQLKEKIISDLELNTPLSEQFASFKQEKKKDLNPPQTAKHYHAFNYHEEVIVDSLHWMAQPSYENQLKIYLSEENKFAQNELVEDKKYQKKLFNKLNNFYLDPPNGSKLVSPKVYFMEEDSLGNDIVFYQLDSIQKIKVLDLTAFQIEQEDVFIKRIIPNESRSLILVQFEKTGIIGDLIAVLEYGKNKQLELLPNIYSTEWFSDSTFLYTKTNKIGRAGELMYRDLKAKSDLLIYKEKDPLFDVEISKNGKHLFCTIQSKTENEIYKVDKNSAKPILKLIRARQSGVFNTIKAYDAFYILVNDEKLGDRIDYTTFLNPKQIQKIAPSNKEDHLVDFVRLKDRFVALVYEKSIPKLKVLNDGKQQWKKLELKLGIGQYRLTPSATDPNRLYFSFSSPSRPNTRFKYDFDSGELTEISAPKLVNKEYYKYTSTKRIWARGHDGTKVPITLIKNKASYGNKTGLILKVYGAYGAISIPSFDAQDAILLEQGFTIAYAHVRGGALLGSNWYKAGRTLYKKNSILDYLSCAEHLLNENIALSGSLIGYGNSAGGLIVSQALNLQPQLFSAVVLERPYLDVINTMMNDTLPFTIDEYKEWGNPKNKEVYKYMLQYSPYQNIKSQVYPPVLLIASYQDYQTPIWQIAKYTSRLRAHNLSDSPILMITDLNSGHIGNTTGKEWIKLFASTASFMYQKSR